MDASILGLGTAVPKTPFYQELVLRFCQALGHNSPAEAKILARIFNQTGIRKRHMVIDPAAVDDVVNGTRNSDSIFANHKPGWPGPTTGQRMKEYTIHAGPLAETAARQALERSGTAPRQITHLVTVSCTGFHSPGVDVELIDKLGLASTTERTHVGYMGCHGALNGMRVARGLISAEPRARVLLCCVELSSIHCVYGGDLEQVVASSLFSDGAAALVAAGSGPSESWRLAATGSCVFPGSTDAMSWSIGDHGFRMKLAKTVPELIARHLPAWLARWLDQQGLSVAAVPTWCLHPGGPKILDAVKEGLGLNADALLPAREVLAEFGNMSSATILFILERLIARNAARPCVALAFGPGLTVEAALFR